MSDHPESAAAPDDLFAALSSRLRDAHRAVGRLDVPDDEKARAARRLLAITNVAKQDLDRASTRLAALEADLAAGRIPSPGQDDDST